jgi:sec-independent protein translocase protein TatA
MPFNIGPFELLIVLILALLILGPGKLPEVGNALGRTIREFRHASTDVEDSLRVDGTARPVTAPAAATPAAAAPSAPVEPVADTTEDRAAT